MSSLRRLAALVCCLAVVGVTAGCQPGNAAPPATASTTPAEPDFSRPGAALGMVQQLIAAAGTTRLIMVEIEVDTVSVSVLTDGRPVTWAYRGGTIGEVASDMAYVDQASFTIDDFNISDVGALFRAAAGASGSDENQTLQIVDYSGGQVMMAVSTVPESRTVFFNPDGSLLETLDFNTQGGITRGIAGAVGTRTSVHRLAVQSDVGAWVDFPGEKGRTVRRQRTEKVPVTTNVRAETLDLPLFDPRLVDPAAIWAVVDSVVGSPEVPEGSAWSVIVDDRDGAGVPRMHFSIGSRVLITDLGGNPVRPE